MARRLDCYVALIRDSSFRARIVNEDWKSFEFNMDEVPDYDRPLIKLGSKFHWYLNDLKMNRGFLDFRLNITKTLRGRTEFVKFYDEGWEDGI